MWKTEHTRLDVRQVYFIEAEGVDRVKIGVANCSHARLKTLEGACPVPLRLLGAVETDKFGTLEKELHKRFAEHRDRGEWFKAVPEIVAFITEHATMPRKPRRPFPSHHKR
jgi:hypothetical protein